MPPRGAGTVVGRERQSRASCVLTGSTTSNVVPLADAARHLDASAVLRHDPERGRQAKPGALAGGLRRVERIEDSRQAFRRNAGARVDDADDRLFAVPPTIATKVSTRNCPPVGIASRALSTRFINT